MRKTDRILRESMEMGLEMGRGNPLRHPGGRPRGSRNKKHKAPKSIINLRLSARHVNLASMLGDGNMTEGVRMALDMAAKELELTPEVK